MQEIVTAISTVGFPIVMCILMCVMNEKQDIRHAEEIEKVTQALNNNTMALQKLLDKIE